MTDPFRLLGLDRSATPDDIRRARRELAKHAHPDTGGDARQMQQLNAAAAAALRESNDSIPSESPTIFRGESVSTICAEKTSK